MVTLKNARIRAYLGVVHDADGKMLPEDGYITYGLADDPGDDGEGTIMVNGIGAAKLAARIVDLINADDSKD